MYQLAAGITAPLFQGGRLVAEVDRSKARRGELAATCGQTVLVALREVEDALTALARLSVQGTAQREAVRQAREADRLADLRFRGGAADFLTVLDGGTAGTRRLY